MGTYQHINKIAAALAVDPVLTAYSIAQFGTGLLVQVDVNLAAPLKSTDCPFVMLTKWPETELGPVIDAHSRPIYVVVGIAQTSSNDAAPNVQNGAPRSATANGLQNYGNTQAAEALLEQVFAAMKRVVLDDDYMLYHVTDSSNGILHLPMQTADMIAVIKKPATLDTF